MLRAGYPLSQVTEALCARWQPGVRLLPMTDDRVETHVVIDDPDTGERTAVHFQEWWIRHRAALPAHSIVPVGADEATPAPGVLDAIAAADVDAARAVEPGGERRHRAVRAGRAHGAGEDRREDRRDLPDRERQAGARHGRRVPDRDRRRDDRARRSAGTTARAPSPRRACSTAGSCTPATPRPCPTSRCARCRCSCPMWTRPPTWCAPRSTLPESPLTDHAAPGRMEILPVEGLPEFRPGDDLTGADRRRGALAALRRHRGRHQQSRVQSGGSAGAGADRRPGGARPDPAAAGVRGVGAHPRPQGADADHREPPGDRAGGVRCGRVQRGDRRAGAAAGGPGRVRARAAAWAAGAAGRRGGGRRHRHHGPRVAGRADRRRRSGRPGSRCCTATAGRWTGRATSSRSPRSRSPTRSRAPRTW